MSIADPYWLGGPDDDGGEIRCREWPCDALLVQTDDGRWQCPNPDCTRHDPDAWIADSALDEYLSGDRRY